MPDKLHVSTTGLFYDLVDQSLVPPPTHVVAALVVLDWTFTVYADGSLKIQTPQGRTEIPELKIVVGPDTAQALSHLLDQGYAPPAETQAMQDFGGYHPGSLGQV